MAQSSHASGQHTQKIAQFVSNLRYEDIPSEVIDRIKLLILDSFGCAIYGASLPWSKILVATLTQADASTGCAIWGTDKRISAPHAALINGSQVHSFELDDVHRVGVLHVGAVTLPALLAVTELHPDFSGRQFLAAAVAGYEIGPRVGICMGPEHIGQGWHSGATVGVFSAVAGAAAGLRLTPEQTVHAIGIAGTQSSGLMAAQFGAMVKRMHPGRASQSGLYGALLAQAGYTGIVDVFENPYGGFCSTFSRSTDRFKLDELSSGLGERYETMKISLKFYSCVSSNHTTLDAIRSMQERRPFSAADVKKIIVHGSRVTADHVGWKYKPEGLTSAQLNMPYCVATLMLDGDVFVEQFPESKLADPARMAFADRVEVHEDPAITALGGRYRHKVRVEVHLNDGTRLEETVEAPRGSEVKFASAEQVIDKFRKLTKASIGDAHMARIVDRVMTAESLGGAAELAKVLATPG